jgi:hypothetical protein
MRLQLLALTALSACSGSGTTPTGPDALNPCVGETRADTFAVGLDKHGAAGTFDFALMSATPAPPERGDNTWIVQLSAMSSGVVGGPLTGAALTVTPFMPDHGHGTPIKVNVTETSTAGQYKLTPINMWMPGYWETTVKATQAASSDTAVFKFCIPN